MSAARAIIMPGNRPDDLKGGLGYTLLLAVALLSWGACSCRESGTATGAGDGTTLAAPTAFAPPSAASATASVEHPLVARGDRFDGPICGLCPPDVWSDLPFAKDVDAPENDDWDALLSHPFAAAAAGTTYGRSPPNLRDSLRHEIPAEQVAGHRARAILHWRYILSPAWLHEPRITEQRALRRGINGSDSLIGAWIKRGRWFQVMTTSRSFALRTSFEPRCGRGNPEQVAAALALAHQLLPAVQPALCAEDWMGAAAGPIVGASIHGRPVTEGGEWPETIRILVDDERVLYSFREPYRTGASFGHHAPPWFDENVAMPSATPRAESRDRDSGRSRP